jgi:hypothetical protein
MKIFPREDFEIPENLSTRVSRSETRVEIVA